MSNPSPLVTSSQSTSFSLQINYVVLHVSCRITKKTSHMGICINILTYAVVACFVSVVIVTKDCKLDTLLHSYVAEMLPFRAIF